VFLGIVGIEVDEGRIMKARCRSVRLGPTTGTGDGRKAKEKAKTTKITAHIIGIDTSLEALLDTGRTLSYRQ